MRAQDTPVVQRDDLKHAPQLRRDAAPSDGIEVRDTGYLTPMLE
jgi:hypothetical protein